MIQNTYFGALYDEGSQLTPEVAPFARARAMLGPSSSVLLIQSGVAPKSRAMSTTPSPGDHAGTEPAAQLCALVNASRLGGVDGRDVRRSIVGNAMTCPGAEFDV